MDFQFWGRQELWIAYIPILVKTRVMDSLHTLQPKPTISMDKIYGAAICRHWTTKRMEIHDANCISTVGSICLEAFSKLCHKAVSGQTAIVSWGRRNRVWGCWISKNVWDRERVIDIWVVMFLSLQLNTNFVFAGWDSVRTGREQLSLWKSNSTGKDLSSNKLFRQISLNTQSFN